MPDDIPEGALKHQTKKERDAILFNLLREDVRKFAFQMETCLRMHDEDRGDSWKTMGTEAALARLEHEMEEFLEAIAEGRPIDEIGREGGDVANFVMFAIYNCRKERFKS